jgi:glycogen debranching enzyme
MPFKVQVGPQQISIHHGQTVLVTEPDGGIPWPTDRGLYFLDTRVLSAWTIYANGAVWDLLNGGGVSHDTARIYLTNSEILTMNGPIAPRSLGMTISRVVGLGLHEDIGITNNTAAPVRFNLEVAMRSDFADIFEVKSDRIVRRGSITSDWSEHDQTLTATYRNEDFLRAVKVRVDDARAYFANGRLTFDVEMPAGGAWRCCLLYTLMDGERAYPPPEKCQIDQAPSPTGIRAAEWHGAVMKIQTGNEEFFRMYAQALEDMVALALPLGDSGHMVFLPAAGLPWFVAPFGRDSLIVSLQTMLLWPEFAHGVLEVLAQYQAQALDPFRDAEPGKILHELRFGELAHFKLIPHTPYYGTADATLLWLITLHSTWRYTGDLSLLTTYRKAAENCLAWIDEWGDRDGDGFQEYQTRSPAGYENMGWKDSGDAVMYEDGTLVRGPKALCELQGYVYDAWVRMAQIYDALEEFALAAKLREKAASLYKRFNEVFWDEARGTYAYTLDRDKVPVFSLVSNIGHLLWSGIVPPERAKRVVARLMQPDMSSGWGIRTLSADHVSYNPYAYQLGAVWPHDNAILAMGFKRYGFGAEAAHIARDISGAASHFQSNQLPELYAGLARDATNFPVQYVGANVPQAWAAGSVFMLVQAITGVMPSAPEGVVYIDPVLPPWLPDITLRDLRVGQASFDIRFEGAGSDVTVTVLKGDASAVVRRSLGEAMRFDAYVAA